MIVWDKNNAMLFGSTDAHNSGVHQLNLELWISVYVGFHTWVSVGFPGFLPPPKTPPECMHRVKLNAFQ